MIQLFNRSFKKEDTLKKFKSRLVSNWIFALLPLLFTLMLTPEYKRVLEDPNFLLNSTQQQIVVTGYALTIFILIIISAVAVWLAVNSKFTQKDVDTVKKMADKKGDISLMELEKSPIKIITYTKFLVGMYLIASVFAIASLQVESSTIKTARESTFGEKHTLNIRLNKWEELGITTNRDFYMLEENGDGYLKYTDNLFQKDPIANHITFFENESAMLNYFDGKLFFNPDDVVESKNGESESYYLNKREEKGQYGYGIVLQKYPYEDIIADGKKLKANYITSYVNSDPNKTETSSEYSKSSEVQSKFCLFDLSLVNPQIDGYVMFSGVRSIGTYVDYCERLRDMRDFRIEVNI